MSAIYLIDDNLSPKERERAIKRGARREGCTCQPDVGKVTRLASGIYTGVVEHDDWCVLLRRIRAKSN